MVTAKRKKLSGCLRLKWLLCLICCLLPLLSALAEHVITPGNFVGDVKSDVTVFRPSTGVFYTYHADSQSLTVMQWGTIGDMPIARSNVH